MPPFHQSYHPKSAFAQGLKRKQADMPTTAPPPAKKAKTAPAKPVKPRRTPVPLEYKGTARSVPRPAADPRPVAATMQQQRAAPIMKRARDEEGAGEGRVAKKARVMEPPMAQKPSSVKPAAKAPLYAARDLPKATFKKRKIDEVEPHVSTSRPLDADYALPKTRAVRAEEAKKAPKRAAKVAAPQAMFSDDEEDFVVADDVVEYRDEAPKKRRKISSDSASTTSANADANEPKASKTGAKATNTMTVEREVNNPSADSTAAITAEREVNNPSASPLTTTAEPEAIMPAADATSPPPDASSPAAKESTEDSPNTIDVSGTTTSDADASPCSAPTTATPTSSPPAPAPVAAIKKSIAGERLGSAGYGIGTKDRVIREPGQKGVAKKVCKNSRKSSDSDSSAPKKKRTTKRKESVSEGEESGQS